MATIVLSAAGASVGGMLGGGVLGLSSAVIGRAVGATLGRAIDQRLMGAGSQVVETGRVDRLRLTGASEGAPVPRLWGRMRLPAQVIWSSNFREEVATHNTGGKGAPKGPSVREYSYSISVALALCEGEISGIGRIWADGVEIARDDLTLRVYHGSATQLPDSKIEAIEGAGNVPAYRGVAYVVIEDLDLGPYGNRVPQMTFEVMRPAQEDAGTVTMARDIRGVAMIPGTGEYALATEPVHMGGGLLSEAPVNVHAPGGRTDLLASVADLRAQAPECRSVSLVVSWFGSDLRVGSCAVAPKVEQAEVDGREMPWAVSGVTRAEAGVVPETEGRPVYGGTPCDASVVQAIRGMEERGLGTVFYPFILMEQMAGNGLPDPWTPEAEQPPLPWRGRITTELAPGQAGSSDGTAQADAEVAAFFGTARADEFEVVGDVVSYTGADGFSYRRFILHYAHLCAVAGGVEAFCIGSEMRGLTQIRGASGFPAVEALCALARDVRAILGPDVKIGYAADWSEYFGYHPQDGSGDVYFHLDPLWALPEIDFIGIDNYMPLSDWREGDEHLDADWGSIYNLDYLKANVAGGEGYDWYYARQSARDAQIRTPITDDAHGEPWVWRYKDIRGWWENAHFERRGGVRSEEPTAWEPGSKPVWFTEYGCAALDKATNQPNKFLDLHSSESRLPRYSDGARDDLMQMQYLRAFLAHWMDPANNPRSDVYDGAMVDMSRAHVWAWDARPYPWFPADTALWADGVNYGRGHWLTGRVANRALDEVVREICARAGVTRVDTSRLYGLVRGYTADQVQPARADLQPLMLAHGFDAVERDGVLVFRTRDGRDAEAVDEGDLAVTSGLEGAAQFLREPEAEVAGRLRLTHVEDAGDYAVRTAEAVFPDADRDVVSASELAMVLTGAEARRITERWLAESRIARDRVRLALPPSRLGLGAGDVIALRDGETGKGLYRIDRVETGAAQEVEATRIERETYTPSDSVETPARASKYRAPAPVRPVFLDLPLLTGEEAPHAPHLAVAGRPWPGTIASYRSAEDAGYALDTTLAQPARLGQTLTAMTWAPHGIWDRGAPLRVRMATGTLESAGNAALLAGANALAIGTGLDDDWEVLQFRDAELVAPQTWDLRLRLRGQRGTDGIMPPEWPAGMIVVVLDEALKQVDLPASLRGVSQHYRIGPASKPLSDPSYTHVERAFDGVGLRPYAPVHLRAQMRSGALVLRWIRRSRIDGDLWTHGDVPLGEAREAYLVSVRAGDGALLRQEEVATPTWTYTSSARSADGAQGAISIEIAQISEKFGPGPSERILTHV